MNIWEKISATFLLTVFTVLILTVCFETKVIYAQGEDEDQSILGQTVVRAAWGSGSGQLGREIPTVGNTIVPKSFVVDTTGKITILDGVNTRLVLWDNASQTREIPLPSGVFDDIDLSPGGDFILLDRTDRKAVVYLDANGNILKEVALEGLFLPYADRVTAMFSRPDGLWVEVNGSKSVKITDATGGEDIQRGIISGRLSYNGDLNLRASKYGDITAVVSARKYPDTGEGWSVPIYFPDLLLYLFALETDKSDHIYLGAKYSITNTREEIIKLDSSGIELVRVSLQGSEGQGEMFRFCRVIPNGTLYYMCFDVEGVVITKYKM